MKTLVKLLMICIMIIITTISLSSESCEIEEKLIKEAEEQLDRCHKTLGKTYKECKAQLKKDKNVIKKQQKTIDKLDKQLGKDKLKHRAQGAGTASLIFIIFILLL